MSGPLQHENTHSACMHAHTHIYTNAIQIQIYTLPSAPSAVIDVLFHSAKHKLRYHGYSCRDALSPGDGQH